MRRCLALLLTLLLLTVPTLAYENVPTWAAQGTEFSAAADLGLIPAVMAPADMSGDVTRLEFCHAALALYDTLSGAIPDESSAVPFSDTEDAGVARAAALGLVGGYPDGSFHPEAPITRQELFKLLDNLLAALGRQPALTDEEAEARAAAFADRALLQSWAARPAAHLLALGVTHGNQVGDQTLLDPEGRSTRAQSVVMVYRLFCCFAPENAPAPEEDETALPEGVLEPGTALTTAGEYADRAAKRAYLFGNPELTGYATEAEAEANQTLITVPVWQLDQSGEKFASHLILKVNVKLAPTVLQIFTEIFHSDEQFPIQDAGAYNWRGNGTSEHNWGTAIDLNWDQNYYIRIDPATGEPIEGSATGSHWLPGEDPLSIPADSELVAIFAKYGFGWGGDGWWTSVRDYMHFSFLGL